MMRSSRLTLVDCPLEDHEAAGSVFHVGVVLGSLVWIDLLQTLVSLVHLVKDSMAQMHAARVDEKEREEKANWAHYCDSHSGAGILLLLPESWRSFGRKAQKDRWRPVHGGHSVISIDMRFARSVNLAQHSTLHV